MQYSSSRQLPFLLSPPYRRSPDGSVWLDSGEMISRPDQEYAAVRAGLLIGMVRHAPAAAPRLAPKPAAGWRGVKYIAAKIDDSYAY